MTTHNFRRGYGQNSVYHHFQQISSVSQNTHLRKRKKCTFPLQFHRFSPMFSREPQEEEQWKEADTYTLSTRAWLLDVTYHRLDTYQN